MNPTPWTIDPSEPHIIRDAQGLIVAEVPVLATAIKIIEAVSQSEQQTVSPMLVSQPA